MADVAVHDGALYVDLTVPERVLSLHGASVVVPLEQIRGVRVVREVLGQLRGLRKPGAGFPGILAIGTWHGTDDGRAYRDFVVVHRPGPGVVITTSGEYDRVLLSSEEPEQFVENLGITI
jgi:hypothetical protein